MLKTIGANNFPDADNKPQPLVGQIGTRALQSFELLPDFGVIDRFFAQQRIELKLLALPDFEPPFDCTTTSPKEYLGRRRIQAG
ncbi:MAG: hypothetical protein P8X68_04260 [Desulfobacterales bacterium]